MTRNENEWYNEWKQMRVILGFTMKQLCNVKLQYIQQRFFWKYNVKQNICRRNHQRCSIKKSGLNNFATFTRKHLKASNFIKKRLQHKCFPVNAAKFLRTPILKNICERQHLHLLFIKTRDAFAAAKLFMKWTLKIDE